MPFDDYSTAYMQLSLGGSPLGADLLPHVSKVEYKDSEKKLDTASVTFELPQGTGDGLVDKYFAPAKLYGKELKVELMRDSAPTRTFIGDVMDISWTRSSGKPRSVTVTAIDKLHRLKRGRSDAKKDDRRFVGVKVTDVVSTVVGDWSSVMTADVESSDAMLEQELHWEGDDASLLSYLAEKYHFTLRVDADGNKLKLIFKKNESYRSDSVDLKFGVHILDVSASHSLNDLLKKVTFTGQANRTGDAPIINEVAASTVTALNAKLGADFLSDFPSFEEHIEDESGEDANQSTVEGRAKARIAEAAEKFVSGSLTCRFLPELSCGAKINVSGAGYPLDGTFLVTDVSHSLDQSGYRSKVSFKANSVAAAGIPS